MSRGSRRLAKLEELARREEREAARTLAAGRRALSRQGEQIEHLRRFLADYESRFAGLAGRALSAAELKGQRAFIDRIETGIEAAVERFAGARSQAERLSAAWSEKSRRLASVQRLLDRRRSQEKQSAARRTERMAELAAARARLDGFSDAG